MNNRQVKTIALCPFSGEYYTDYVSNSDLAKRTTNLYNIGLARQKEFTLIEIDKSLLDSLGKSAYNRYIKSRNS